MFNRNRNIRYLVIFATVMILAGATYAFAAANTVPASKAGDGNGGITGYTVSAIHYNLSGATPTNIDSVDQDQAGQCRLHLVHLHKCRNRCYLQ
jgi:hypothetical protein